MYSYEERRTKSGYDCWGNTEYETIFIIKHNEDIIFTTRENPKCLVEYLNKHEIYQKGESQWILHLQHTKSTQEQTRMEK